MPEPTRIQGFEPPILFRLEPFCARFARRARFSRSRSRFLHLGHRAVKEGTGHSTQIFIARRRARSAFRGISLPLRELKQPA